MDVKQTGESSEYAGNTLSVRWDHAELALGARRAGAGSAPSGRWEHAERTPGAR
jgi:hypothetical protein